MPQNVSKLWIPRIFLASVGVLYLYLAIWCSIRPESTSKLVGFDLHPGSGQSEFLTVYGGLEFGMALFFLLPLIRPASTLDSLLCCLLIHAGLVAFRSAGFLLYSNIQPMTWKLAAGEWVIFLLSLYAYVMVLRAQKSRPDRAIASSGSSGVCDQAGTRWRSDGPTSIRRCSWIGLTI